MFEYITLESFSSNLAAPHTRASEWPRFKREHVKHVDLAEGENVLAIAVRGPLPNHEYLPLWIKGDASSRPVQLLVTCPRTIRTARMFHMNLKGKMKLGCTNLYLTGCTVDGDVLQAAGAESVRRLYLVHTRFIHPVPLPSLDVLDTGTILTDLPQCKNVSVWHVTLTPTTCITAMRREMQMSEKASEFRLGNVKGENLADIAIWLYDDDWVRNVWLYFNDMPSDEDVSAFARALIGQFGISSLKLYGNVSREQQLCVLNQVEANNDPLRCRLALLITLARPYRVDMDIYREFVTYIR